MKKLLLLAVTLVLVSCGEKGIKADAFPQIPEECQSLVPSTEPIKINGSTERLRVKMHFDTFLLCEEGVYLSNEFDRYTNLTGVTLKLISVRDLQNEIKKAQKQVRGYRVEFFDERISNLFEEKGRLYIRNETDLYSYNLNEEIYFLQLERHDGIDITYNWFPIKYPVWKY